MGRRAVVPGRVAALLGGDERHCWTLEDLRAALSRGGGAPDPSSVFRAVCRLQEEGLVRRVELDDRRARFELAEGHHEHVVCERCGDVAPLSCALAEAIADEALARAGFQVTDHRIVLSGVCATCREGSGKGPGAGSTGPLRDASASSGPAAGRPVAGGAVAPGER